VADPSLRGVEVTVRLDCPVETPAPFDSYASAMSLAALLAGAVLAETVRAGRPEGGRSRVAEITELYAELSELE
jgi:hypothetical protein